MGELRHIKNTVVLAAVESAYGVFSGPWVAADHAILLTDATIEYGDQPISRDLIRPYFGASEQLVGTRSAKISFACEIAGSGAAGTAPAYGKLLRGCAMAETITAGQHVIYNPISTGMESLAIRYVVDGANHVIKGCRGTVDFSLGANSRPLMKYTFTGVESVFEAATGLAPTSVWKAPMAVSDANTGDILIGCTYATGAVSGGTAWPSLGIDLSLGADAQFISLLGSSQVDITGREVTGSAKFALSAANEVQLWSDCKTITERSLGFKHGVGAGNQVWFYMPNVQFVSPKYEDIQGYAGVSVNMRAVPVAGNDELRIIVK